MAWTESEALAALRGSDLLGVGMQADELRRTLQPENVITYMLAPPAGLTLEAAAQQARAQGSDTVMLSDVAGLAGMPLEQLAARLLALQHDTPLSFHHLPAPEMDIQATCAALQPLHAAGVRSLLLPLPTASAQAESLLRAASALSIEVTGTYTIGRGESAEQRVADMQQIARLQRNTHAIQCLVLRIHHARTPEARREEEATAVDYLKTLAVARLFLDTIPHVTAEWEAMGPKVLELALRFGADDAGAVAWSQGKGSPSHHAGEAEMRRIIRDAGFRPVERDALFRQCLLR
jgi:cyclic dehypoxanthinyl futalosine synthase